MFLRLEKLSDRQFHKVMIALLAAFYIFGYILPLGLRDMMIPDEYRYGEIPREMIADNDWVSPKLVGVRYFEKPALGYQWTALSMKIFGENAFAVRLPSALSVGMAALLVYWLCARQQKRDRYFAPLATVIFMSFALVLGVGSFAVLDSQLSMALTWCIGAYFLSCQCEKIKNSVAWLAVAGVAAGAAFLFKGFLAFAVPAVVIAPYLIWQKDWKKFLTTPWLPLICAVLLALPWSIAVWKAEPDFWNYFFFEEHVKRFTSGTYDRDPEPFWFFVPILLGGMLPGGFLLLGAWKGLSRAWFKEPLERFCLCWFLMPFLLFSASSCKTGTYILPCFPPLAILTASALLNSQGRISEKATVVFRKIIQTVMWCFVICGVIALPLLIVWRIFLVDKLPYLDPARPYALIAALLALGYGALGIYLSREEYKIQILFILGLFFGVALWLAPVVLSNYTNPQKMPEKTLREIFRELEIKPDDVIALDRSAASPTAWILHRNDLKLIGRMGEFNYGFTKYPKEYAKRYYTHKEIDRLLEDCGERRLFYVNFRGLDERSPYPKQFKVKRVKSKRGITVVEVDK